MTVLQEKKWGIRITENDQIVKLVSSRSRLPDTHTHTDTHIQTHTHTHTHTPHTQMRSAFKYLLFLKAHFYS